MDNNNKKRNKPSKDILYKNEREEFLNELNIFLDLTDDNNTLFSNTVNNDVKLQDYINKNEDKIKKYFKYGKWGYYRNTTNKKDLSALIKNIYKYQKYTIFTKPFTIKNNNNNILTTQLIFYKPGRIH